MLNAFLFWLELASLFCELSVALANLKSSILFGCEKRFRLLAESLEYLPNATSGETFLRESLEIDSHFCTT